MSEPRHRLQRILALIPYVRKHPGARLEDLARYCGATPAEILSDLDRVLLCGVPPYLPDDYIGVYVDDDRVEIRFADHFRRPIRFTLEEALALLMAIESLPEGEHSEAKASLRQRITDLMRKSLGAPPAGGASAGPEPSERLATHSGRGPTHGIPPWRQRIKEVLDVLAPAIEARRKVRVAYYSASSDATTERVVHPLGIVRKSGETYLVAYCEQRGGVRTFRVDRLRSAVALEQRFTPPERFDLERYERSHMDFDRDPPLQARVRIDRRSARWVREQLPEHRVEPLPDGGAIITIPARSERWLLNEVLSYGAEVELLEPPELREALHRHLVAMREAL
ncbi:MAG: WYL domain-containing protein [Planctomycetota bacterium]|nr:MAG: WYL domain-containing protein [Planctomycetota bacterium]